MKIPSRKLRARIQLYRMQEIAANIRDCRLFTAASVAKKLEVTPKTIHRDIEFMRNFLGYKMEFDTVLNTWRGEQPAQCIL